MKLLNMKKGKKAFRLSCRNLIMLVLTTLLYLIYSPMSVCFVIGLVIHTLLSVKVYGKIHGVEQIKHRNLFITCGT